MKKNSRPPALRGRIATSIDVEIGVRIKAFRVSANKTQKEVADSLGITFQQVQKYESGKNRLSVGMLIAISDLLQISTDEILFGPTNYPHYDPHIWSDKSLNELARIWGSIEDQEIKHNMLTLLKNLTKTD